MVHVYGAPNETPLIRTARGVNDGKIHHVIARAAKLIEAHPGAPVACLGLAYKADIDDFRESPARLVAATLARRFGSLIRVVEPYAAKLPIKFTDTGATLIDLDEALESCAVLIVLADHDVFRVVHSPNAPRELSMTRGGYGLISAPTRRAAACDWQAERPRETKTHQP